ncbi:MAG TPA: hypothetical protein VKT72_14515 [Candidatus Baltobacteraceae bacterium]|nr:hypothetical protein [Candidatus Baltobacteraceae bacterium]
MSVELYPNIEDLDERLSVLEDPELAQRILSANPQLFESAAAREEVAIFAMAWKRFGALALAVTAALAVGAGFAFAPHTAARPAIKPVVAPVAVREKSRALPRITKLVVQPPRHRSATAPATVTVPVAAPSHHTVAYHQAAAAAHIAAPAAHAVAAPAAASNGASQAEAPLQYQANTQIVSGNVPPTDSAPPSYSKSVAVADHGDAAMPATIDNCTPTGGRLSYLIKN